MSLFRLNLTGSKDLSCGILDESVPVDEGGNFLDAAYGLHELVGADEYSRIALELTSAVRGGAVEGHFVWQAKDALFDWELVDSSD
jgi:hypothetical protein